MRIGKFSDDVAMKAIERAAATNAPCPQNEELAGLVGAASISTGARLIASLERKGLIKVTRFGCRREVTIVATGASTARVEGSRTPHFSLSRARRDSPMAEPMQAISHAAAQAEQPRVYRDPCFRCGVRGDIGCEHQRAAA